MHYSTIKIYASKLWQNYLYYLNNSKKKIIPVIKSNAYGHGMYQIAYLLQQLNVDTLAVATFEEAQFLRHHNIGTQILILNPVEKEKLYYCYLYNFIISIPSLVYLREISKITFPLFAHLKINTGLNRFGIKEIEIEEVKNIFLSNNNIKMIGIYSHLVGGEENKEEIEMQIANFIACLEHFENKELEIHLVSTNSIKYDLKNTTAVRVGIGLYGLDKNSQENTSKIIEFSTKIIDIKKIEKGSKIGYNSHYEIKEDGYLYTIPIGYADLPPKNLKIKVLINGEKYTPITRFMNSSQFFSTTLYKLYEEVSIINNEQSILEIAKRNKKSPYEISILLPKDVNREIIY